MHDGVRRQYAASGGGKRATAAQENGAAVTFDDLERAACGRWGLSADDFWSLTLRSVTNIMQGRAQAEDARERGHWERTRWAAATYLQPHLKKGSKLKLTDLISFPWEETAPVAPIKTRPAVWDKWDEEMKKKWQ